MSDPAVYAINIHHLSPSDSPPDAGPVQIHALNIGSVDAATVTVTPPVPASGSASLELKDVVKPIKTIHVIDVFGDFKNKITIPTKPETVVEIPSDDSIECHIFGTDMYVIIKTATETKATTYTVVVKINDKDFKTELNRSTIEDLRSDWDKLKNGKKSIRQSDLVRKFKDRLVAPPATKVSFFGRLNFFNRTK